MTHPPRNETSFEDDRDTPYTEPDHQPPESDQDVLWIAAQRIDHGRKNRQSDLDTTTTISLSALLSNQELVVTS